MIEVFINGESKTIEVDKSLAALLVENKFDCARIAAAVNSEFVARDEYAIKLLHAGDVIDVVAPVAGG